MYFPFQSLSFVSKSIVGSMITLTGNLKKLSLSFGLMVALKFVSQALDPFSSSKN